MKERNQSSFPSLSREGSLHAKARGRTRPYPGDEARDQKGVNQEDEKDNRGVMVRDIDHERAKAGICSLSVLAI